MAYDSLQRGTWKSGPGWESKPFLQGILSQVRSCDSYSVQVSSPGPTGGNWLFLTLYQAFLNLAWLRWIGGNCWVIESLSSPPTPTFQKQNSIHLKLVGSFWVFAVALPSHQNEATQQFSCRRAVEGMTERQRDDRGTSSMKECSVGDRGSSENHPFSRFKICSWTRRSVFHPWCQPKSLSHAVALTDTCPAEAAAEGWCWSWLGLSTAQRPSLSLKRNGGGALKF